MGRHLIAVDKNDFKIQEQVPKKIKRILPFFLLKKKFGILTYTM